MMKSEPDWSEKTLNRADLKPKKRLDDLIERSKAGHIDHQIPIKRYIEIGESLLYVANRTKMEANYEESLMNYLRYQSLIKKLKTHARYEDLPIGQRSAFDYKLKDVLKSVKNLSELVLEQYKKFYKMSKFDTVDQNIEGYQDQRPTLSTVRTFITADKDEAYYSQTSLANRPSTTSRTRSRALAESSSAIKAPMHRIYSAKVDANYGLRRSIFPTKQFKDFDVLYSQRRIVRSHRTVIVPSRVTTEFSYLSYKNTKKNVETVGYLAGKELNASQFIVSHLILPEQVGFSDYFKVRDSKELIRYLDEQDLLTLGWIHSHPQESNYLSSSDMHYHSVFQSVLPEAIAMVYSPKFMSSSIFSLTPNHGLKFILNCSKNGFHTHPTNPPLVMIAQHAMIELYGDLVVKDFRDCLVTDKDPGISHTMNVFERMLRDKSGNGRNKPKKSEVTFVHSRIRQE